MAKFESQIARLNIKHPDGKFLVKFSNGLLETEDQEVIAVIKEHYTELVREIEQPPSVTEKADSDTSSSSPSTPTEDPQETEEVEDESEDGD